MDFPRDLSFIGVIISSKEGVGVGVGVGERESRAE